MADCDGTLVITREKGNIDRDNQLMQKEYGHMPDAEYIDKIYFNVIPRKMSDSFNLVEEV